jgi:hypothetical protein
VEVEVKLRVRVVETLMDVGFELELSLKETDGNLEECQKTSQMEQSEVKSSYVKSNLQVFKS